MEKCIIIAEAGVNHNGDINLAKRLVEAAAEAGADYVKFQTFKADKLVVKNAGKADYQKANMPKEADESQLSMLKKLELSEEDHGELIDYCREKNIKFLSTAFDAESVELLKNLGVKLGKVPSGEITNLPYLELLAKSFERIILSTGMADLQEVENALEVLTNAGADKEKITVLHCTTEYPTPMRDVNLRAMRTIQEKCDVKIGYSDHTLGIEIPIAAVALGASVIEKHFTLDRTMEGPDHKASLEPHELAEMVRSIRNVEKGLGDRSKQPSESEKKNIQVARRSLVAARAIKKGEVFSAENLTAKRPGTGLSPMLWHKIIGQTAEKDFEADEMINL